MTKYSEGPWNALPTHDGGDIPYIESAHGRIAVVTRRTDLATEEDFDNARLMAASLELLYQLRMMFNTFQAEMTHEFHADVHDLLERLT